MPSRRLPPLVTLRAFEAAGRLGSFKAAAEELCVTPGAVSQHIRRLEEDLGARLFNRGARSVELTEMGRDLLPAFSGAFAQMTEALERVRPHTRETLRVESSDAIIGKWLLPRLNRFESRCPDLILEVLWANQVEDFEQPGPDLRIRLTRTPPPGLYARKIVAERVLPLASPALIERLDIREPKDVVRARLLHDSSPEAVDSSANWAMWLARLGLDPELASRGMRFDRHAANQAIEAAANGVGVLLGREFLAQHDLQTGKLVSPFGPAIALGASYYVLCRDGDERRPDVAAFIAWVEEEAAAARR